ncbi:hypothetical protein BOX15_Mlig021393g1 [Macrostomum lignano]|uniref:Uncharacterized protein n=1 Tax=Macrostomum lignano TaxID=282301 RepID=A0A267GPS7_9PLAT|nr:hypothetical protein BOX15_Mlig021393g1 [Macrostomum lignano]
MSTNLPVGLAPTVGLLGFFDGIESSSGGGAAASATAEAGPPASLLLVDQDGSSVGCADHHEAIRHGRAKQTASAAGSAAVEDNVYRLNHLPWVALTESDSHVLDSTLTSLKSRSMATVLAGARFFKDVLARDFPAEVFLQRSGLLACLVGLAAGGNGGGGKEANSGESAVAELAIDSLLLYSDRLAERIGQALDPDCHVPPRSAVRRRQSANEDGRDDAAEDFTDNDEDENNSLDWNAADSTALVDPDLQWSAPRCAIELAGVAVGWLGRATVEASSSPSTRRLQLSLSGASLLGMCIGEDACLASMPDRLAGLLDLWATVLHRRSLRDEVSAPADVALAYRRVYATLLPCLIDLTMRLAVNSSGCVSDVAWQRLPRSTRQELLEACRCEASLLGLSNYRRRQLLTLLFSSGVEPASADCLVERRSLDSLGLAMSAACRFLRQAPDAAGSSVELFELLDEVAPVALPAVGVAGCVGFVVQFVQAYSRALAMRDSASAAARGVLLGLLAHRQATLRKRTYATCLFVLQTALSIDSAMEPGSCEFRRARFLLDRDVLYQIAMFGLDSEAPPEVREMAQELLCRVLESRPYTDADTWRRVVETCQLVLPVLQAHTDLESGFGRCLLAFCGTQSSPVADAMSRLQRIRACLRLLYSPDVDVRREGVARACAFLTAETDSDAKQPVFLDVNLKHMMNLVYVDQQQPRQLETASTLDPSMQIEGLNKVYEIFRRGPSEGGVDPAVRKSAGEQVSIFLQNPGLHRHFIVNLSGLQYTMDLIQRCLRRDEAYLSMVLPACISILRRLALLNREVRRLLAEDYTVYSCAVRCALHLNYDSSCKLEVSQLLALLLYDEMTPPVPKTVNDFSLPAGLVRRLKLPFRCTTYDLANPHAAQADSCGVDSLAGQRSLRLLWNLAWQAGGSRTRLLALADKQPDVLEDYSERMRLSELDWHLLRAGCASWLAAEAIQDLSGAKDHAVAGWAVDRLTVCRLMTEYQHEDADSPQAVYEDEWDSFDEDGNNNKKQSKSRASGQRSSGNLEKEAEEEIEEQPSSASRVDGSNSDATSDDNPTWIDAADRFVRVRPASSADYRLLCRLLDLLLTDLASQNNNSSGRIRLLNWLLSRLAPPDGVLLYIVAMGDALVCDTDSERLADAKRRAWRSSVALAGAVADCLLLDHAVGTEQLDLDAAATFVSTVAFYLVRRLLAGKHLRQLAQLHDCLSALLRLTSTSAAAADAGQLQSVSSGWNWATACPLQAEEPLRLACLEAVGQVMDSLLRDRVDVRDSFMGHGSLLCLLGLLRNLAADCQGQAQGQTLPPLNAWKIPLNWACLLVAGRHQLLTAAALDFLACLCRISDSAAAAVHSALESAGVSADGAWGLGLALLRPGAIAGCSPLVRAQACDLLASLIAASAAAAGSGTDVQKRLASESSQLVSSLARQLLAYWPEPELPPSAVVLHSGAGVRRQAPPGVCTPRLLAGICRLLQNLCCLMPNRLPAELAELKVTSLLIGLLDPGLLEQCARSGQLPDRLAQPTCSVLRLLRLLACDDLRLRARLLHDDRLLGRLVRLLKLRWSWGAGSSGQSGKSSPRPPQPAMLRLWTEACQTLTLLTYGRELGRVDPGAVNHVAAALANRLPACLSALSRLLDYDDCVGAVAGSGCQSEGSRSALLLCHAVLHSPDLKPLLDKPRGGGGGECEGGEDAESLEKAGSTFATLGARFAHRLMRRYDTLWTLPTSVANSPNAAIAGIAEDRATLTAALKMLLLASRSAKTAALNAGFVEALLETFRRPSLTSSEARQTAELLQHLMHSMPEAKLAAASGCCLADRVQRLWPTALTQPALMLAILRLLAVFTSPPPSRCAGLSAGLIQALLRLAGQDNQLWREADLIRRACFSVLSNAALTSPELRSSLVKSRFVERFNALPSGEQQLSKSGKSAAADWLRLLGNLSISPDGQVALLSQPSCLQKLCDLATTNDLRRQCRALLCLRNLSCHPGLRMRILACQQRLTDCLQSAMQPCQRLLRSQQMPRPRRSQQQRQKQNELAREARVLALTASLLRALLHGNQRAKAQLRSISGLADTLAGLYETLLSSLTAAEQQQQQQQQQKLLLLEDLSPEEAGFLLRDLKLVLTALQP